MTATRWVCVHGHFYQPPRENPWLDAIEPQPSAHPYPDWNARITAECYRPNAWARIVDHEGRIVQVVDNYARMRRDHDVLCCNHLMLPSCVDAVQSGLNR